MAKYEIRFFDVDDRGLFIETASYQDNQIGITLTDVRSNDGGYTIFLDKSTAIKFAKTLRTEINKIKEVDND
jgi:hypothetical protein